ncbi:ABC transporter substrate-binding protein [Glycomyces sp. TRM65418]|uniref:ABC transporter substrate-binding protein n=1 Tax=Glycomyces sp. TRM65418 TaxID=2867006 RepID=UPI001CE68DE7|nr:ABC transporter substrate-binding protein [Glycomyces sp. TRM65418]MCC3761721.1 ABC transporter substrate-binding protein [Glycomyces sp. TRM65418]QZD55808.1 ABC transporter substrate-binding protein [Glycomyces sp. TRM65418]
MAFDADSVKFGRRGLLAGGGALGLTGALAACGAGDDEDGGSAERTDPWSFTDDQPATVELPATPTKIVAFTGMAAALYDFGIEVPAVFGPTTNEDGTATSQAGNLPVADLEVFGNVFGEFDVEAYAAWGPEVLMTHYYYDPATLWYVPEERKDEITSLAEVTALNVDDGANTLDQIIGRHAELAESLGADLASESNAANKERYDAAVEALREAAAANPVTVLACSAAAETFYASNPAMGNDMRFFTELGVDFVVPDALDESTGGYYETLSWENADKYPADILFLDSRVQALQPEALTDFPTWNALPAVQEGQIVGWEAEPMYGYGLAAASIEALAEAITNAKKLS